MSRVAIIHPAATFESHPTLRNAAVLLARAGHAVDIFIRRNPAFLPPSFAEDDISVHFSPALVARLRDLPVRGRGVLAAAVEAVWLAAVLLRKRYRLVIGVDPAGFVVASAAGVLLSAPIAYLSLEILLHREITTRLRLLKALERRASRRAEFVLVQDEERAALLRAENGFAESLLVLVPNAPLAGPAPSRSRYWHEKFGLPDGTRVALYAGSAAAWTGVSELIESTHAWPEGWALVVHFRERPRAGDLERMERSAAPGRVHFSTESVPQDALDELFAGADVGIAFYFVSPDLWYTQENLRSVGLSSGKVAYYLRAGLPVIVNEGTSLADFVREEGCGVVVGEPAEVGGALSAIGERYERVQEEARRVFAERLDFATPFGEVIRRVDALAAGRA